MAISIIQPVSNFNTSVTPSPLLTPTVSDVATEIAALSAPSPSVLVTLGTNAATAAATTVAVPSLLVPAADAGLTLGITPTSVAAAADTLAFGNPAVTVASAASSAAATLIASAATAAAINPELTAAAASATPTPAPVADTATSLLQGALSDAATRAVTNIVDPGYASVAATLYLNAAVYRFKTDSAIHLAPGAQGAPESELHLPLVQRIPPRKAT